MKWVIACWLVLLIALHQDFWLWTDRTLLWGVLPIGLAYHVGYAVVAALTMALLVRYAWPKGVDDQPESKS
ncbi:MAG: DUF3311 domain-containing protein [Planctomycetota bacterium]